MHVLGLPGRRRETAAWLTTLLAAGGFSDPEVVRYRHWTVDVDARVDVEAAGLADRRPDLVVAKSLGTVIAATAFGVNGFRPARAVLIGTPYAAVGSEEVLLLQRFATGVPTLFIQQVDDPGGSAAELSPSLQVHSGTVAAVPGDDHVYADTGSLGALIRRWNSQQGQTHEPT